MQSKSKRPTVIKIPIYDVDIEVFSDTPEYAVYYKRHGIDIVSPGLRGFAWDIEDKKDDLRFLICIPLSFNLSTLLTIVHEIDHMAWMILKHVGIHPTYEDNEAHTYLVEFILENIIKKYYKLTSIGVIPNS